MTLYTQVSMSEMARICVASTTDPNLLRALVFSSITKTSLNDLTLLTTRVVEVIRQNAEEWESEGSHLYRIATLPKSSIANQMLEEAMSKRNRKGDPIFGSKKVLRRRYHSVLQRVGIEPHEWFLTETPPWAAVKPPKQPITLPGALRWLSLEDAIGQLAKTAV